MKRSGTCPTHEKGDVRLVIGDSFAPQKKEASICLEGEASSRSERSVIMRRLLDFQASYSESFRKPERIVFLDSHKQKEETWKESLTSHRFFSVDGCPASCWKSWIACKRAIPRFLYLPLIFLLACAIVSTWVVPVAWWFAANAANFSKDRLCYAGPTINSTSLVYKTTNLSSYQGTQSLGRSYTLSTPAVGSLVKKNGYWVNVFGCPALSPGQVTQAGTWWDSLQATHWAYISTAESPDIAAFWQRNVPDLSMLALVLRLTTPGNFDPVGGTVPITARAEAFLPYPNVVPATIGAFDQSKVSDMRTLLGSDVDESNVQFFNVEWTVLCNGIKLTFSSTSDSYASFPCTTPVASWFSYSTSLFPFDQYGFGINVVSYVTVTSLKNKSLSYRMATPIYISLTQNNPAFVYTLVTNNEDARWFGFGGQSGGNVSFPIEPFYGLPHQVVVRRLYNMQRSPTLKAWSMFIVVLLWMISLIIFLNSLDNVFLRPRDVHPGSILIPVSMMFAMNAIRNSQPGVPPIGISNDIGGFLWNELILMVAAVMLLCGCFQDYKHGNQLRKESKKRNDDKKDDDKAAVMVSAAIAIGGNEEGGGGGDGGRGGGGGVNDKHSAQECVASDVIPAGKVRLAGGDDTDTKPVGKGESALTRTEMEDFKEREGERERIVREDLLMPQLLFPQMLR